MNDAYLQHTLRKPVDCIGRGLHSGQPVAMTIRPAAANRGVAFLRRDIRLGARMIDARWHRVSGTDLSTTLSNDSGTSVATVEHLLAALTACGVDNAIVELDGPEVPIMDGSAAPFVAMIESVGIVVQPAERRAIWVHRAIEVRHAERLALLAPGVSRRMTVTINFPDPAVGQQALTVDLSCGGAVRQLVRARTFGFKRDLETLRARGLARGGSLGNAVLIDEGGILNPEGLRFADEFVRHKALDCLGDLSLAGAPIIGHFHGHKPGHALNNALLAALFTQQKSWSYVPLGEYHQLWTDEVHTRGPSLTRVADSVDRRT